MAPRETENNAYAKFWGDKQRTLWYVMVFLEWSVAVPDPDRLDKGGREGGGGSSVSKKMFFAPSGLSFV